MRLERGRVRIRVNVPGDRFVDHKRQVRLHVQLAPQLRRLRRVRRRKRQVPQRLGRRLFRLRREAVALLQRIHLQRVHRVHRPLKLVAQRRIALDVHTARQHQVHGKVEVQPCRIQPPCAVVLHTAGIALVHLLRQRLHPPRLLLLRQRLLRLQRHCLSCHRRRRRPARRRPSPTQPRRIPRIHRRRRLRRRHLARRRPATRIRAPGQQHKRHATRTHNHAAHRQNTGSGHKAQGSQHTHHSIHPPPHGTWRIPRHTRLPPSGHPPRRGAIPPPQTARPASSQRPPAPPPRAISAPSFQRDIGFVSSAAQPRQGPPPQEKKGTPTMHDLLIAALFSLFVLAPGYLATARNTLSLKAA